MKNKYTLALWVLIGAYILYFSFFTILRYQTLYASYFDLGIMHQTVYNTYQAIVTLDPSRILELTNPFGPEQIKRMAIHNDLLLVLIAPLYFIYSGPEALLVVQTIVIAFGAFAIHGISQLVFTKSRHKHLLSFVFVLAYLLYSPLQRMNIYEFHAVALATTFLLYMFYFWLKKRYVYSSIFFILSIITKEQVALTTAFFGLYALYSSRLRSNHNHIFYSFSVFVVSIIWFLVSMLIIIPAFRGENHFALGYYGDFGDSPLKVVVGVFEKPASIAKYIFHIDTLKYFFFLLGPMGFLSLLSPTVLLIAAPEFGINLLSNSWHMRNIIFHYTAVIQPFVFISAMYGTKKFVEVTERYYLHNRHSGKRSASRIDPGQARMTEVIVALYILVISLSFAFAKGPLPFSREQEVHPFKYPQVEQGEIPQWKQLLQDDSIKVSATGQLAPHFTSRRYFYVFSQQYYLADYVVLRLGEIYNYPEKDELIPVYAQLVFDPRFERVYKKGDFEVYRKVKK